MKSKGLKSFITNNFYQDLKKELLKFDITNAPLSKFNDTMLTVLDKHAPKKPKYVRVYTLIKVFIGFLRLLSLCNQILESNFTPNRFSLLLSSIFNLKICNLNCTAFIRAH